MTTHTHSAVGEGLIPWTGYGPVAPSDYLENFEGKAPFQPEKGLMLAVLADVVACFQKNVFCRTGQEKRLFQEAEAYIRKANRDWLFSFENICETLGFDPGYVRRGLECWKDSALQKQRSLWDGFPTERTGTAVTSSRAQPKPCPRPGGLAVGIM